MTVSVTEAKNKPTQLLTAVEKGERVTIQRHSHIVAEIVKPSPKRAPKFGTFEGGLFTWRRNSFWKQRAQ